MDFTNIEHQACNFYLLVAANGFGKTTALETMASLMGMLGAESLSSFGQEDLDSGRGRAQLDVRVRAHWEGRDRVFVLSMLAGVPSDDMPLKVFDEASLDTYGAGEWQRAGFIRTTAGSIRPFNSLKRDGFVADLWATVQAGMGNPPEGFESSTHHLPTLMYFSAYRDIPSISDIPPKVVADLLRAMGVPGELGRSISQPAHWGYRSAHRFEPHNEYWSYSLDNLLVWLKWLDDDRFNLACRIINERVFEGTPKQLINVRRDPPEAIIQTGDDEDDFHRLDRLSSGEKNLVQLFLRIGAHMTRNTILLLDEFDVHLHIRWQHGLFNALKGLVGDHGGVTVIATTHSVEILDEFVGRMDIPEKGKEVALVKGGHLINDLQGPSGQ
jgi:energy-coupling factor transporter ATP-binding protein EcfA2